MRLARAIHMYVYGKFYVHSKYYSSNEWHILDLDHPYETNGKFIPSMFVWQKSILFCVKAYSLTLFECLPANIDRKKNMEKMKIVPKSRSRNLYKFTYP